ncbi:MAG: erythromycin biosynthesis sensory transduction protein eryC1 [Nitrosomonadaceae bacterium]|nr:erythromycin biosynthesis sensory transduction protein eryC1 [Nitrosomonadaceae bacterium]
MDQPVPFVDLGLQYENHHAAFEKAIIDTAASTQYIMGAEVSRFEKDFSDFLGVREVVSVASGTDALRLSCLAHDIGPADEILVPANTFIASILGVCELGAQPIPVDVDPETHLLDISDAETRITSKTKGIIPVHLYGQTLNMDSLLDFAERHGLFIIEDACQAHGAEWNGKKAGGFATTGCFSFFPSKNLGAFGDGGAIAVNDSSIAKKLRLLRNYGSIEKYVHETIGTNSRLDSIQAAILNVKLTHLEKWNNNRFCAASRYSNGLADLKSIKTPLFDSSLSQNHVFHLFVIQCEHRDKLQQYLTDRGIQTGIHYPVPIHLHKAFEPWGYSEGTCPIAEKLSKNILSLPMFPEITNNQIDIVINAIKEFYNYEL